MVELLSVLFVGVAMTIIALARYKHAQAELEWAKRCDPKNPHFRPPLIGRP